MIAAVLICSILIDVAPYRNTLGTMYNRRFHSDLSFWLDHRCNWAKISFRKESLADVITGMTDLVVVT